MPIKKEDEAYLKSALSSIPFFAKSFLNKKYLEEFSSKLPESILEAKVSDILDFLKKDLG